MWACLKVFLSLIVSAIKRECWKNDRFFGCFRIDFSAWCERFSYLKWIFQKMIFNISINKKRTVKSSQWNFSILFNFASTNNKLFTWWYDVNSYLVYAIKHLLINIIWISFMFIFSLYDNDYSYVWCAFTNR